MHRRYFLRTTLATAVGTSALSAAKQVSTPPLCGFVKFIQDLSPEAMAEALASMGYNGMEATIRKGGQIEPEAIEDELPGLVEALRKRGLSITIMASNVHRADDPLMEKTLRVAASLGVRRYRMGYYRYDFSKPLRKQIANFKPVAQELAALNKELGMQAIYQNHAGAHYVGGSLWDLDLLLEDIAPQEMAVGFDVRHATVEGGTTWRTLWHLIQPRLGAVYVKDFVWEGRRPRNVALGQGQVDPAFFSDLASKRTDVPFAVHVEYLREAGVDANVKALADDLLTLRRLLGG